SPHSTRSPYTTLFRSPPESYGPPAASTEREPAIIPMEAPPGIPPALLQAAETAADNYPSIRTAEAELRASRADLRSARWLRFPRSEEHTSELQSRGHL